MNRFFLFFFLVPVFIFSDERECSELLQVDVVVKVVSAESEELWSLDLTKFTISERAISLNLKGFDGELSATMIPVVINSDVILLKTASVVKSLETGDIIQMSEKELVTGFNEVIIFYPIGNPKNIPNVIMELKINRVDGVDVEN